MGTNGTERDTVTFTIKRTYLYVALALVIGFGGGFGVARAFLTSDSTPVQETAPALTRQPSAVAAPAPTPQPAVVQVSTEGRPYQGPEDAPVTMVEFTDYQCPFCSRHFRETMPQLVSQYGDEVKYVVLNFPLSNIHPFAQKAAEAAECAYDQGEFWQYHDLLFENQSALDTTSLKKYAVGLGLDVDSFNTCLDSGEKAQQVQSDLQAGQTAGVRGTPTFFINGQRLVGALPLNRFQTVIDGELTR